MSEPEPEYEPTKGEAQNSAGVTRDNASSDDDMDDLPDLVSSSFEEDEDICGEADTSDSSDDDFHPLPRR